MSDSPGTPEPAPPAPEEGGAGAADEAPAEAASEPAPSPGGVILRGATVSPGLVLGKIHRKDYDLARARAERVPLDGVEKELNRLQVALEDSREQLADLKGRLEGRIKAEDARILDTHIAYLKDSVFIADVENLILGEQMRLEAAITKVIGDFDRIFRLVQNATLRQSAVDLRDVGIRVLRNLESRAASDEGGEPPPEEYVLVARELSIVDMFNLANERVQGIVTEEGSMTSHAAIFARSMRIPTLTGVEALLDTIEEGDFVILDATEGCLRIRPDDVILQQYVGAAAEERSHPSDAVPDWARGPVQTHDGVEIEVSAACGNLPEVEQAAELGLSEVGLYRTELLFLVEKDPPSRDALVHHYSGVISAARGGRVTFRLLNADAGLELGYLHPHPEGNPHLGRAGIRALLGAERVLRRQLQAVLIASDGAEARIVVPFLTDCGELRRLKEVLFEERFELKKGGVEHLDAVELGAVIETPAALLGLRDLAREADFLMINLDSLVQYLLASDRENAELSEHFETLHPMVLRALAKAAEVAKEERTELSVFGVTAVKPAVLPLLLGLGLQRVAVAPAELRTVRRAIEAVDLSSAAAAARRNAEGACAADTQSLVVGYRHGYAPE
ncbi:MAG: phosphoenolpyruvate--protein phosphotransferase [Planctomycetota bacterium]